MVPLAMLRNPQRFGPGGSDAPSRRRGATQDAHLRRRCPAAHVGHRHLSPTGERAVGIARLWVEDRPSLAPGERATVRLVPLTPPTGRTSGPAGRSPCTRTGPWPAPQSSWRFTALPLPCPRDDATFLPAAGTPHLHLTSGNEPVTLGGTTASRSRSANAMTRSRSSSGRSTTQSSSWEPGATCRQPLHGGSGEGEPGRHRCCGLDESPRQVASPGRGTNLRWWQEPNWTS